jgi:hypothetical protein
MTRPGTKFENFSKTNQKTKQKQKRLMLLSNKNQQARWLRYFQRCLVKGKFNYSEKGAGSTVTAPLVSCLCRFQKTTASELNTIKAPNAPNIKPITVHIANWSELCGAASEGQVSRLAAKK